MCSVKISMTGSFGNDSLSSLSSDRSTVKKLKCHFHKRKSSRRIDTNREEVSRALFAFEDMQRYLPHLHLLGCRSLYEGPAHRLSVLHRWIQLATSSLFIFLEFRTSVKTGIVSERQTIHCEVKKTKSRICNVHFPKWTVTIRSLYILTVFYFYIY